MKVPVMSMEYVRHERGGREGAGEPAGGDGGRGQGEKPRGVNSIAGKDGRELVECVIGSGATEAVVGEGMLECLEIKDGAVCLRGVECEAGSGGTILSRIERKLTVVSSNGWRAPLLRRCATAVRRAWVSGDRRRVRAAWCSMRTAATRMAKRPARRYGQVASVGCPCSACG